MANDKEIEQKIAEVGANIAPRVTAGEIDSIMESLTYQSWVIPDTTCTVVASIMHDGFLLALGQSASVSKENFNAQIGYEIAMQNCAAASRNKLWELEGYALKKALTSGSEAHFVS